MKNDRKNNKLSTPPWSNDGSGDLAKAPSSTERWIITLILTLVVLLAGGDIISDFRTGASLAHLLSEGAVVLMGLIGIFWIWRAALFWKKQTTSLNQELTQVRAEAVEWKATAKKHLEGLGAEIERQFDLWNLTPAEKEVGLLLLKGLSLQEIADLRNVSERTVRQQAQAVYHKAHLKSRTDLSAFFLEELLLPSQRAEPQKKQ